MGSRQRGAPSDGLPLESAYAPSLTMPIRLLGFSYCKYSDEARLPSVGANGNRLWMDTLSCLTVWRCAEEHEGIRKRPVLHCESGDAVINSLSETLVC